MSDQSAERTARASEAQQAFNEATERERRLQVWLGGMLAGDPSLTDAVKEWRQGLAIPGNSGAIAAEQGMDPPAGNVPPTGELLLQIRRRVRERRALTGKAQVEVSAEECGRRTAQVIEGLQLPHVEAKEATPLQLVLAARYIEGEIDYEQYRVAILGT